jgi:hypothetical protein
MASSDFTGICQKVRCTPHANFVSKFPESSRKATLTNPAESRFFPAPPDHLCPKVHREDRGLPDAIFVHPTTHGRARQHANCEPAHLLFRLRRALNSCLHLAQLNVHIFTHTPMLAPIPIFHSVAATRKCNFSEKMNDFWTQTPNHSEK